MQQFTTAFFLFSYLIQRMCGCDFLSVFAFPCFHASKQSFDKLFFCGMTALSFCIESGMYSAVTGILIYSEV